MKKLFLIIALFTFFGAEAQPPTFQQIHNAQAIDWVKGVKYLGIPFGTTPSLNGTTITDKGALYYNTGDSCVYVYNGASFIKVGSSGSGGSSDGNNYTTALSFSGGTLTITRLGLSDITTTGWDSRYLRFTDTVSLIPTKAFISNNYYTKTQLQTSGQAAVHWDNITNKPTTVTTEVDPTVPSWVKAIQQGTSIYHYLGWNGTIWSARQISYFELKDTPTTYLTIETDPTVDAIIKAIPITTDATTNKYYYWNNGSIGRHVIPYSDISGTPSLSGYELLSNKATNLTSPDNTKYPTTLAVSNAIAAIPTITASKSLVKTTNDITLVNDSTSFSGVIPHQVYGYDAGTRGWLKSSKMVLTSLHDLDQLRYDSASGTWVNFTQSGGSSTRFGYGGEDVTATGHRSFNLGVYRYDLHTGSTLYAKGYLTYEENTTDIFNQSLTGDTATEIYMSATGSGGSSTTISAYGPGGDQNNLFTVGWTYTGTNKPVRIGADPLDASAELQVNSTEKGFIPPRMNTTQMNAISSPATGLIIWNSDSLNLCKYNGSVWTVIGISVKSGSFTATGTATTTFTVTFGGTQPNNTYKVQVTPTDALAAALFYVTNKTTTTFDVVYLAGLTGTVTFDWLLTQ